MTTIEDIKEQCREAIRLGDAATKGPWKWSGTKARPNDAAYLSGKDFHEVGCALSQGGFTSNKANADFIARARTFSPLAAKALLELIAYVEEDLAYLPLKLRAQEKLESIRTNWTL